MEEDEKRHHEELQRYAEQHRTAWQVDVQERRRLDKMADEKEKFAAAITSRRSAEFEALKVRQPFGCWLCMRADEWWIFGELASLLEFGNVAIGPRVCQVYCSHQRGRRVRLSMRVLHPHSLLAFHSTLHRTQDWGPTSACVGPNTVASDLTFGTYTGDAVC